MPRAVSLSSCLLLLGGLCALAAPASAGAAPAVGQETQPPQPAPAEIRAGTAAAVSVKSEEKLRAAFEHIYNLEFGPARKLFKEVAQAEPQSATVCAFWASALLYEILAHQGSLQSQLFVTTNEFLHHPRAKVDPALDAEFHRVAAMAEERAQRRLARNPEDADGLFGLGLVYGSRANYLAGVQTEYLDGVRMGEKAYDVESRLRALRPEIHDAGVVLGVREYVIGSLPRTARFVLFFLGARGSQDKGLTFLREAAEKGEFLRTYAKVLLTVANIREGNLDQALALLEELQAAYPRNPIFLIELAKLYRRTKHYARAVRTCGMLMAVTTVYHDSPRLIGPEDGLIELGLVFAAQKQFDAALKTLAQVEDIPDVDDHVRSQALLERGKIYDQLGQRQKAIALYRKVTDLAVDLNSIRAANRYKYRAYQPSQEEK
jgi:tetratricopeptide (TPR) repeat protein